MVTKTVKLNNNVHFGGKHPFVLIAGPCVIESPESAFKIAQTLQKLTKKLGVTFVFKASYDKANRTSIHSFRGPGIVEGLQTLAHIKNKLGVPVLSDVHTVDEATLAGEVLDVIQIPAFLCRQTDLIVAAAKTGRIVNVKKGQFLAPLDVKGIIKKMEEAGNSKLLLTERGSSFGYNTLITDFKGMCAMRELGYPVVFDATHSVQKPGGLGHATAGESQYIPALARAAVAVGIDGLFIETHPDPAKALSDGPNMLPLNKMEALLKDLIAISKIVNK